MINSLLTSAGISRRLALAALTGVIATSFVLGVTSNAEARQKKPTVAILYFEYKGKNDELAQLQKGLAQMLITDLSELDGVTLVERERLEDVLKELKLNRSKSIDKKTAARVGKLLGAKYMVLGSYFDLMGTLRVDARVVETETGKVIKSVGTNGKTETFFDIEGRVSKELEAVLTSELKDFKVTRKRKRRARPKKAVAVTSVVTYSRALDAIDAGDKETAKAELTKVVEKEPEFTLAAADLDKLMQ